MQTDAHMETMKALNLNQSKIEKMITRAVQACMAYERGEMTMKQVWYRARGDRFSIACQYHPDKDLGMLLYELTCDFYTFMDGEDHLIHETIFRVLAHVARGKTAVH